MPPSSFSETGSIEFLKQQNAAMKTRALTMALQGQNNSSNAWAMTSAITVQQLNLDAAAPTPTAWAPQQLVAPAPMGSPSQLGDTPVPASTAVTIAPVAAFDLDGWPVKGQMRNRVARVW
jgi:hypothetical protein